MKQILLAALAASAVGMAVASEMPEAEAATESPRPASSWWEESPWANPDRGFNWYPDPQKPRAKKPSPKDPPPKKFSELKTVKEITAEFERLRDRAILNPTRENMRDYLVFQDAMYSQSAQFADMYRRVNWQTPSLDRNVAWPQANFARVEMNATKWRSEEQLMRDFARTHGILLFYRSDCQYCHLQAPVLKMLADKFGVEILPISLDGGPIDGFTNIRPDNGISRSAAILKATDGAGIEVTPTMILVSRDQKEATLLGAGILAMDEIVERVRVLKTTQPGKEFR